MKAKTFAVMVLIALVFLLGILWLLNHAYIIVTFWVAVKIMGVIIALILAAFVAGRVTKPSHKETDSPTK